MNADPTSLDRLHDIVMPPPISWWPPTLGWLVVGIFFVFVVGVSCLRAFVRWQGNCYRREALRELEKWKSEKRLEIAMPVLAALLKRAALTAYPREDAASLSGSEWLTFLDRTGNTTAFTQGTGAWFGRGAYDPRGASAISNEQIRELERLTRNWLKHHRVDVPLEEDKC